MIKIIPEKNQKKRFFHRQIVINPYICAAFSMISKNSDRAVIYWLLTGCFIVYLMVVIGCITRLTHSGLSMSTWSMTGGLPPMGQAEWQQEFARYQATPQFQQVNVAFTVEEFKSIFWWEWIHRFIGRTLLGGTFIAGFFYFLIRKKFSKKLLPKMLFLFGLGAFQGVIGWWMVKSGLVKDPTVSHYRLAIHLMSAFSVFAFTFWFALQLMNKETPVAVSDHRPLRPIVITLLVVVIAQIVFGAFVAGLKAKVGLGYPSWPTMNGEWFPAEAILVTDSFIKNFFETGAGVQWIHRTFAFVVVLAVAVLWVRSNKLKVNPSVYRGITFLIYGTAVQFVLGVFTILYQAPVVLGVLHQSGAFFLFTSCVYLLFQVTRQPVLVADNGSHNANPELNPAVPADENAAAV
jgi:heme a synthase